VIINMVASVDGKAAMEGKASGLGTEADRSVMRTLRSKADAVMVGGGTLRAERLSLGLDAEDLGPRPLGVVLSNTGDLPMESNLLRDPRQNVLVLLSGRADKDAEARLRRLARVRRVPGSMIDPSKALRILKFDFGVELLLCEGGPRLNHALISADLADELFVTLTPMLLGASDAPAIVDGTLEEPDELRLLSVHPAGDELFLRYGLHKNERRA
jgi:riboflavin-specific deaminase-like protein